MKRYHINFDRLMNMLSPSYLRSRKFVLLLQSLVYPLQSLNEKFVLFAKEHQIETYMTSQNIWFTWYLNHKFSKYLVDANDSISIEDAAEIGVPVYRKDDPNMEPCTIWYINDDWSSLIGTDEEPKVFYHKSENKLINQASFTINVPKINISQDDFVPMLVSVVNMYKIAGKTFRIIISE